MKLFSLRIVFSLLLMLPAYLMAEELSVRQPRTLDDAIHSYSIQVRKSLKPQFAKAGIQYPPKKVTLLAMKDRHLMELWASDGSEFRFIKKFSIWGTSGELGPKLLEGDKQVPEGIYQIVSLNPNSKFHLSMELNYPNDFDQHWAAEESRHKPGSDIFIHGKSYSEGCLAMGDKNIEELFILAVDSGIKNIQVVISPKDPRNLPLKVPVGSPDWLTVLYQSIEQEFIRYRVEDK